MNDLVSIIMPSYNTANYISQSIKTVLGQTYENWELIIIDDCSTDNTDCVVQPYLTDSRIHYYKNPHNLGAAISRNKALAIAKGKWIAFLDSDDLWAFDKLEKQISFMEINGYHFSYSNYYEIDESGELNGQFITGPNKITKAGFLNYCWPGCLTVMYDREKVGTIQIDNIRKNNDYAIWLKVSEKADCYLLNQPLAFYRKRSNSISSGNVFRLVIWHYKLFRICCHYSVFSSLIHTIKNLVFGIIKKIYYVRQSR